MKYDDDTFYIELFLNVVIKASNTSKKNKLKKIQRLMEAILRDEDLDIVKSDSNIVMMSEAELLNTLQTYVDDGDLN
jgi:hypothetical protein